MGRQVIYVDPQGRPVRPPKGTKGASGGNAAAAFIAFALVGAFAYASGGHFPGTAGHAAAGVPARGMVAAGRMPGGSSYTRASWAAALLKAGGFPATGCNRGAITAWETAEGSTWSWHNPLDTTQPGPGSHPINHVKVQSYPDWRTGFAATIVTLHTGRYGPVLAALAAGNDAQAVADAVAASPWGTQSFQASCAR